MWEKVKFKSILSRDGIFIDGDWIESKDQDQNGEIRLIQLADIGVGHFIDKSSRFMTKEKSVDLRCTYLKKDDILIARMPDPIGRCCVFPFEEDNKYVTVVDIAILRPNNKNVSTRFLQHYINSEDFQLKIAPNITGTTRQRISRGKLENLEIPLPPFPIQEKIATILDKADELRRKDKELQSKYDELAQAIFIDMFGDPVRNEKGWEVKKLEELCSKILSGNTPKGGSEVYVESGIKFFRSQNVWKNRLDLDDIAYIDEATHKKMKNTSLKNKDILITKTGRINTENSSLGRAALYNGENDSANLNGHVYLIRVYSKFIIPEFLVFILTTIQYRDHIRSVCVGGIDKRQLNKEHIQDFPIILPPLHLQQSFARKIELINQLKAQANAEKSEELFQSLLQKAFKGELVS
ncbi:MULTISPECIES: restriction endonuclease subunit S [Sphingobacterium]|uniref:restriction endonuclease subunit S n=1 Tax=Sphingobacterium TaxID=28453 RepID=UPI000EE82240|nr:MULTISPECIES: restriction endonuclease subunit S [Sphingobacterium]HAL50905.1 restriction endonuclease subunit S [Sphingobacterium sp.]